MVCAHCHPHVGFLILFKTFLSLVHISQTVTDEQIIREGWGQTNRETERGGDRQTE